ncbi:hypothetical protein SAMN05444274_11184 [Mariniphaga anaerophila]|uniref:Uncharacterized protein n=2 Tax=Mariniphaga anaerophila TaxID=1484053 RepID=A0A1M5FAG1_9BACT|nr:hypothetical protein SAMN05444274_11184 [Mariniphaga anaerophila]
MTRKELNIFFWTALSMILLVACSKNNETEQDESPWNKNNTVTIQFYSRLNNETLFQTSSYTELVNQLQNQPHRVAILHCADASLNTANQLNPTVSIAAQAGKVPLFNKSSLSDNEVRGSGVLIGHTTTEMKTLPVADGCTWFSIPTYGSPILFMSFSTISFEEGTHISPGATIIRENIDDETVMIGTINKTLREQLESEFPSEIYRFVSIEGTSSANSQAIFILTTKRWIVRESTEIQIDNKKISSFQIQVEKLE